MSSAVAGFLVEKAGGGWVLEPLCGPTVPGNFDPQNHPGKYSQLSYFRLGLSIDPKFQVQFTLLVAAGCREKHMSRKG